MDFWTQVPQILFDGLFLGAIYALIALGYSMVYGIIKLLNFAHGDIFMLGAFIGYTVLVGGAATLSGFGTIALIGALLIAMLLTGLTGVLIELVAYRRLRSAPRLSVLITAVGMSFFLEYGVAQVPFWGPNPHAWPEFARMGGSKDLAFLGIKTSASQLILMSIAVVLMVALALYIGKTREGRAMRAIALDQRAATLMGINVNRTISMVFFIGSALAGAAGVLYGAFYSKVSFLMGFLLGLKAFTAAVIGGIGNLYGAMLGGLLLGVLEQFGARYLGGEWKDIFAFVFLILFLTVRPTGILGARVVERM